MFTIPTICLSRLVKCFVTAFPIKILLKFTMGVFPDVIVWAFCTSGRSILITYRLLYAIPRVFLRNEIYKDKNVQLQDG